MSGVAHHNLHGVLAEYDGETWRIVERRHAREAGYRQMEAYSPFHVDGLAETLGYTPTRLPWLVLAGGVTGIGIGFALQWFVSVIAYPLNVGGRPLFSWPAFIRHAGA